MLQTMVYRGAISAAAALLVALAARFLLPKEAARRYALPIAFAAGFSMGYVLLPDARAPLWPQRTWHWLPYVALAAGVLGPMSIALGVHFLERRAVQLLLAFVTAILVTPTWASLDPPRQIYIPIVAASLFLLCALLEPLGSRTPTGHLLALLAIVALAGAAVCAAEISVSLGEVVAIAACAAIGCAGGALGGASLDSRGFILGYVLITGGLIFVIHLEPEPARRGLLLLPFTPLALWIGAIGPISRLRTGIRSIVQAVLVLLAVGIAVAASVLIRI